MRVWTRFFRHPLIFFIFLLIVILGGVGTALLLKQNQEVKHKLTREQNESQKLMHKARLLSKEYNYLENLESKIFPRYKLKAINRDSFFITTKFTRNTVLLLFDSIDCSNCIRQTFRSLNNYYNDTKDIDVYGIILKNSSKGLIRFSRAIASFPVFVDSKQQIDKTLDIRYTPLILYIQKDTNQIIYAIRGSSNPDRLKKLLEKVDKIILDF